MRSAYANRVETKKRVIVRGMVKIEYREKAKGEEYLVWLAVRSPCSQRSEMTSRKLSCGR
jgi:hypothetical protein